MHIRVVSSSSHDAGHVDIQTASCVELHCAPNSSPVHSVHSEHAGDALALENVEPRLHGIQLLPSPKNPESHGLHLMSTYTVPAISTP